MSASLVGSEMCIRDRARRAAQSIPHLGLRGSILRPFLGSRSSRFERLRHCLLYTSDAADDM
eukprot:11722617-Alexandrium_andersonii.AAC.1